MLEVVYLADQMSCTRAVHPHESFVLLSLKGTQPLVEPSKAHPKCQWRSRTCNVTWRHAPFVLSISTPVTRSIDVENKSNIRPLLLALLRHRRAVFSIQLTDIDMNIMSRAWPPEAGHNGTPRHQPAHQSNGNKTRKKKKRGGSVSVGSPGFRTNPWTYLTA